MPTPPLSGPESISEAVEQRIGGDEVRERSDAVDLDHRERRAVVGLEPFVTRDVDHLDLERHDRLHLADDGKCLLTEMAALGTVQLDVANRPFQHDD